MMLLDVKPGESERLGKAYFYIELLEQQVLQI